MSCDAAFLRDKGRAYEAEELNFKAAEELEERDGKLG